MVLKEQELLQIDEQFIHKLLENDPNALAGLSINLANDLKEALERLNQNPSNSSKPSSSLAPWDKGSGDDDDEDSNHDEIEALKLDTHKQQSSDDNAETMIDENPLQSDDHEKQRKPGRQPGSQGFGRTQTLDVTETKHHLCGCCTVCNEALAPVEKAYTGFQTINIEFGNPDKPGVHLSNTHHLYYTGRCPMSTQSRNVP